MNQIKLNLENTITIGNPKLKVFNRFCAEPVLFDLVDGLQTLDISLNLNPYDKLSVELLDRVHNHNGEQTTVSILDIYVDEINLQHCIFEGKQYPNYPQDYFEQFHPPEFYQPGTVFYQNGVFEIDLQLPIWKFLLDNYEKRLPRTT